MSLWGFLWERTFTEEDILPRTSGPLLQVSFLLKRTFAEKLRGQSDENNPAVRISEAAAFEPDVLYQQHTLDDLPAGEIPVNRNSP